MESFAPGASYRWARLFLRALRDQGLRDVVVAPGSRSAPLVAAAQDISLGLHPVVDERAAGFFALGLARSTGRGVGVITTSGSAGGHLLPAVMEADASRIPLLLLTADRPPHLVGAGASQTTDQTRLFEGFLRRRFLLPPPEGMPGEALVRVALQVWQEAHRSPGGPVHVNIPLGKPLEPEEGEAPEIKTPERVASRGGTEVPVEVDLSGLLRRVPRTVVVVGEPVEGVVRRWVEAMARVLPVWASPLSGVQGGWSGYTWLARHPQRARWVPDGVVQVGSLPLDRGFLAWVEEAWHPQFWVQMGLDGRWVDPFHRTTLWIPEGLPLLPDGVAGWNLARVVRAFQEAGRRVFRRAGGVWGALYRLLDLLPSGVWWHVGASLAIRDLEWVAGAVDRLPRVWMNRGLNGIDGLVATAAGEAAGSGPGVLWMGDVAFLHDVGSLRILAQRRFPLLVVVVNNRGGRIFEELPIARYPDLLVPYFIMPHEVDLSEVARAFGLPSRRVHTPEAFLEAVEDLWRDLPAVMELVVDPEEERTRREAVLRDLQAVPLMADA